MTDKLINKIISVAYGDANIFDIIHIKILAIKNREVSKLLNEYKATACEVRTLKEEVLPEEIMNKVAARIGAKTENKTNFTNDILSLFITRPIITSAAALILILSLVTTMFILRQNNDTLYTQEEIEKAGLQTKQVFETISEIFSKTENYVKENVLKENVAKPMTKSFNKITKAIKEGDVK